MGDRINIKHGASAVAVQVPVALDRLPPSSAFEPLVAAFYLYEIDAPKFEGVARADLGHLRFVLDGSGTIIFGDGREEPELPVSLHGPDTSAWSYRIDGPVRVFGIALRAMAWGALIGRPAVQFSNHIIDASALFGRGVIALLEQLRACATLSEMVPLAEDFFAPRVQPVPPAHAALVGRVHEWLLAGSGDVDDLHAASGLSARHVTRLLNQYFGGPPKLIERKARAIRAAVLLREGREPAEVAAPYYDQSHMIREVRHFIGFTPQALKRGIDPTMVASLSPNILGRLYSKVG